MSKPLASYIAKVFKPDTDSRPVNRGREVVKVLQNDRTVAEFVRDASHYKAIGETDIYLFRDVSTLPWEFVTHVEEGGTHRLGIPTSVRFTALHPCGLTFSWTADIEPLDANGSSSYHIDVDGIQRILAKIPSSAAEKFSAYLAKCADAVEKRAAEFQSQANERYGAAEALRKSSRIPATGG